MSPQDVVDFLVTKAHDLEIATDKLKDAAKVIREMWNV